MLVLVDIDLSPCQSLGEDAFGPAGPLAV